MTAMTMKMAKNEPKTSSIFLWPFWGFGSSTGIRQVSHPPDSATAAGHHAQRAASSSTVRLRPARTPTTICGIIRPAMRAIGSPQPPLLW
jgi:hypothetical protein